MSVRAILAKVSHLGVLVAAVCVASCGSLRPCFTNCHDPLPAKYQPDPAGPSTVISVMPTSPWTETAVTVRKGERLLYGDRRCALGALKQYDGSRWIQGRRGMEHRAWRPHRKNRREWKSVRHWGQSGSVSRPARASSAPSLSTASDQDAPRRQVVFGLQRIRGWSQYRHAQRDDQSGCKNFSIGRLFRASCSLSQCCVRCCWRSLARSAPKEPGRLGVVLRPAFGSVTPLALIAFAHARRKAEGFRVKCGGIHCVSGNVRVACPFLG